MGWSPKYYIPSFVEIGPSVLEKIFEEFAPFPDLIIATCTFLLCVMTS